MIKTSFILSLFLFFSLPYVSLAQWKISIDTNFGNDTLKTCKDSVIKFKASVTKNNQTVSSINCKWDFDDGESQNGTDLFNINHTFTKSGGYRVMFTVWDNTDTFYTVIPVEIGLEPDFSQTESDVPNDKGICKGDEVLLTGKAETVTWKSYIPTEYKEKSPAMVNKSAKYFTQINYKEFSIQDTIKSGAEIDSVGLYIEHSNSADLQIVLSCPNGKAIILKDYGGIDAYMGIPVDDETDNTPGTPYYYYWTNTPEHPNMNTITGVTTLQAGSYAPFESFDNLAGCPYNGDWSLTINDRSEQNNGYVSAWQLKFNPANQPELWSFSNNYDLKLSIWAGDGVSATSNGVTTAIPTTYGNTGYKFFIKDNFGCWHDTTIIVLVEPVSFEYDPDKENKIGDKITFTDNTSWAVKYNWDFGDTTYTSENNPAEHIYMEKGDFIVKLKVYSSQGCVDYDTANIHVEPIPIEITQANIFTPNGDDVNDIFTFFGKQEKITIEGREYLTGVPANVRKLAGRIYNRYGQPVCKWDNIEEALQGWDGTPNNNGLFKCSEGTYYYILNILGKDGKEYDYKGTIFLYIGNK